MVGSGSYSTRSNAYSRTGMSHEDNSTQTSLFDALTEDSADSSDAPDENDSTQPNRDTTGVNPDTQAEDEDPWKTPEHDTSSGGTGVNDVSVSWGRKEIGPSYPVTDDYHCNTCHDFSSAHLSDLQEHIETHDSLSWSDYLGRSGLHRCACCEERLQHLSNLYCEACTQTASDRISCRNCGTARVKLSDPFCSATCAGERIESTRGVADPLNEPASPNTEWLAHPHRLPTGIPSAAPIVANNRLACRECYQYGSDGIHEFAVHVAQKHELEWADYIEKHGLRKCRVCGEPLRSLFPLYCGDECRETDPNPVRRCDSDVCETAVERGQQYCSRDCFYDSVRASQD